MTTKTTLTKHVGVHISVSNNDIEAATHHLLKAAAVMPSGSAEKYVEKGAGQLFDAVQSNSLTQLKSRLASLEEEQAVLKATLKEKRDARKHQPQFINDVAAPTQQGDTDED
ncbi:MAG: hypothetical protein AAGJ37_00485 [Pseudomonadota bacterium]